MCHVKNKSCPVASQNSNIICNIISIQMRYSNQSESLLTICHLARTLKRVLFKQLSLSYLLFLFPHHPYSAMTRFHVQHKSVFSANELSQDILFIGSAPCPQALILLKIAAAARTYGLDLCSERRFDFVRTLLEVKE